MEVPTIFTGHYALDLFCPGLGIYNISARYSQGTTSPQSLAHCATDSCSPFTVCIHSYQHCHELCACRLRGFPQVPHDATTIVTWSVKSRLVPSSLVHARARQTFWQGQFIKGSAVTQCWRIHVSGTAVLLSHQAKFLAHARFVEKPTGLVTPYIYIRSQCGTTRI